MELLFETNQPTTSTDKSLNEKRLRKPTSFVWNYFGKTSNGKANCNFCSIKLCAQSGNLWRHLRGRHNIGFRNWKKSSKQHNIKNWKKQIKLNNPAEIETYIPVKSTDLLGKNCVVDACHNKELEKTIAAATNIQKELYENEPLQIRSESTYEVWNYCERINNNATKNHRYTEQFCDETESDEGEWKIDKHLAYRLASGVGSDDEDTIFEEYARLHNYEFSHIQSSKNLHDDDSDRDLLTWSPTESKDLIVDLQREKNKARAECFREKSEYHKMQNLLDILQAKKTRPQSQQMYHV